MAVVPNANALLVVADLLGESGALGITAVDQATTDMIQELINRASDQIERYCRRAFKRLALTAIRLPGQVSCNLRPPRTPIDLTQTLTLSLDGVVLTIWKAEADGDPALKDVIVGADVPGEPSYFYRGCGWLGVTPFPILATLTAGFATVPGDVKQAATLTVQAFYRHQKGQDPYQSYPASATGGTVVMRADTIPRTAEYLLDPYRMCAL